MQDIADKNFLVIQWVHHVLQFWMHKLGGLHKNHFIVAAKSDELYS